MIIASLLLIFAAVVMLVFGVGEQVAPLLIGSIVATLLAVIVLIGSARRTAAARLAAGADGSEPAGSERRRPAGSRSERARPDQSRSGRGESVHSGTTGGRVVSGTVIEGSVVEPAAASPGPVPGARAAEPSPAKAAPEPDGIRETPIPSQARPTVDLNARRAADVVDDEAGGEGDEYAGGEYADDEPPGEPPPQLVSPADAALVRRMDAAVLVVDGRPRYHRAGCGFLRGRPTEPLPVNEAVELGFTPCGRCEPDSALIAGARSS